jgi:putative transposase
MMPVQGRLTIERMCQLAGVSRAGFYRWLQQREPVAADMELRSALQRIVIEHRGRYGYRRVQIELGKRGMRVNHKRLLRIMREDNLLAIQPKAFVATTDSRHSWQAHLNLACRMTLSGINQLWVADITYIRLRGEFVFLAAILDVFSRKVVGWALARHLRASLPLAALRQALAERQPPPGLVHHSDGGWQYACGDYVDLLEANHITPSMSRPGNPYDNAFCESFMKTLKREEIYAHAYRDLEDLRAHLKEFIERYYNRIRLHSALGYVSPEQFERQAQTGPGANQCKAASMSFFQPAKSAVGPLARIGP